jgi:hypothetical protein
MIPRRHTVGKRARNIATAIATLFASFGCLPVGCPYAPTEDRIDINQARLGKHRDTANAPEITMTYKADIEAKRRQINRCERHVEAQRQRFAKLGGGEADKWVAKQLLTASENTLRDNRAHFDCLVKRSVRT